MFRERRVLNGKPQKRLRFGALCCKMLAFKKRIGMIANRGGFLLTVGAFLLTVEFFAYSLLRRLVDALAHCKQKSSNYK